MSDHKVEVGRRVRLPAPAIKRGVPESRAWSRSSRRSAGTGNTASARGQRTAARVWENQLAGVDV
jgi:hypothetical protein